MSFPPPRRTPARIRIDEVEPSVDRGHRPAKATIGEPLEVSAEIVRDGHDELRAVAREGDVEVPMRPIGSDRFASALPLVEVGEAEVAIEAWVDHAASWREELARKVIAGQEDLESELAEGAALLRERARRLRGSRRAEMERWAEALEAEAPQPERAAAGLAPELAALLERHQDRTGASRLPRAVRVSVERERARFGAWYELFPRSFGGFRGVEAALPRLAELGFDVLYFPPIHPIGQTNRKGANNALQAGAADPGSPWAIGSREGGHTAIDPGLGTMEDFERLVAAAAGYAIEIALDFAIQCSPDHPWLREHPEWFHRRPDGTLKYAENPPKRYQDIYNLNFASLDWRGLWEALRDVVLFWIEHGVRIFRVDNPHTKPLPFWEWLIAGVRTEHPDVVFLSEAFTRPGMMYALAKIGFSQSYTYFTWRNTKAEITEYLAELSSRPVVDFFRPNFFANTPDILHAYLQEGGPPAFHARLVLAATLSPSYGIYSGFESYENVPVRPGSEEYLDSEKYEIKHRTLDGPLLPVVARLNAARRARPALQHIRPLQFLETANERLIAYAKGRGADTVVTCVNLDPKAMLEGLAVLPDSLGLPSTFAVRDLLTDTSYTWRSGANYVRLEPGGAHLMGMEP